MALPDFLVIGAPKAGTTALHAALAAHPGLYLSAIKEPKFFLTDGPPPDRGGGPGDVQTYREHVWRRADYEALFADAPADALRGESTPFYLYDRDAQRRIGELIPHAKMIVILRDPVERAHSNWTHLWSAGLEPVTAGVREAEALDVKEGAALMLVERTAYTDEGTPVEFARDLFRGDRTRLVMWTSELPARL